MRFARFDDDVLHELVRFTGADIEAADTTGSSTGLDGPAAGARSRRRSRSARPGIVTPVRDGRRPAACLERREADQHV
jgi:hypothetical protein